MNKNQIRKLALVGAAAALSLQLVAGTASAAVPTASATGFAYGTFGGDGYAGFSETYTYGDSSTLSKLYLESDITGGASVPTSLLTATKNGQPIANACSVQASPLAVLCLFKTIRYGDVINVTFAVAPQASATSVSTEGLFSSTGYVIGGNQSHGDAWSTGILTATRSDDPDNFAGGFGNTSLNTSTTNLGGNGQAASLKSLPNGKYAFVNDNAAPDASGFPIIELSVNGGAPATFQLVIVYPKGTNAPKGYEHVSDGYPTVVYAPCAKGDTSDCFVWSNKTNTATLYLSHNGGVRRL